MARKKKTIHVNRFGVKVRRCCASCAYKAIDTNSRYCAIQKTNVSPDYICPSWELSDGLENAGKGGGCVKDIGYLRFVAEKVVGETDRAAAYRRELGSIEVLDRGEIRKEWYQKNKGKRIVVLEP